MILLSKSKIKSVGLASYYIGSIFLLFIAGCGVSRDSRSSVELNENWLCSRFKFSRHAWFGPVARGGLWIETGGLDAVGGIP